MLLAFTHTMTSSHSKDHEEQGPFSWDLTSGNSRKNFRKGSLFSWLGQGLRKACLSQPCGYPFYAESSWLCSAVITAATEVHGGLAEGGGFQDQGKTILRVSGDTVPFCNISFGSVANTAWVMDQTQPCSASCWHQNIEWWFIYWEHSRIIFYPMCIMWYLDIWVNPAPMRPFRE